MNKFRSLEISESIIYHTKEKKILEENLSLKSNM